MANTNTTKLNEANAQLLEILRTLQADFQQAFLKYNELLTPISALYAYAALDQALNATTAWANNPFVQSYLAQLTQAQEKTAEIYQFKQSEQASGEKAPSVFEQWQSLFTLALPAQLRG